MMHAPLGLGEGFWFGTGISLNFELGNANETMLSARRADEPHAPALHRLQKPKDIGVISVAEEFTIVRNGVIWCDITVTKDPPTVLPHLDLRCTVPEPSTVPEMITLGEGDLPYGPRCIVQESHISFFGT
jgi:hypothetical protein